MTAVIATDRPKPHCNRCVIKVFDGVFILSCSFLGCSVNVGSFVIGTSRISSFSSLKASNIVF